MVEILERRDFQVTFVPCGDFGVVGFVARAGVYFSLITLPLCSESTVWTVHSARPDRTATPIGRRQHF
jgi:hypothetical protein